MRFQVLLIESLSYLEDFAIIFMYVHSLGGVQYMIYVPFFSRLFPGAAAFAAKSLRDKMKDAKGVFQVR